MTRKGMGDQEGGEGKLGGDGRPGGRGEWPW